jgi:hypothetical protein
MLVPGQAGVLPALAARAIREELITGPWGRRYVEFEQGDWETLSRRSQPSGGLASKPDRESNRGIIVNRWDVTGERLHSYIRPHEAVTLHGHLTQEWVTYHLAPHGTVPSSRS